MISAFDRTLKLGVSLSVIDWLTFNIVFLLSYYLSWFPFLNWEGNFLTYFITSNIAYIIALQFVTISLHHRWAQPAKVLSKYVKDITDLHRALHVIPRNVQRRENTRCRIFIIPRRNNIRGDKRRTACTPNIHNPQKDLRT